MRAVFILIFLSALIACRKNDPRDQYAGNYNCTAISQQQNGSTWITDTSYAVVPVVESGKKGNDMIINGTVVTLSGSSFTDKKEHGMTGSFTGNTISFAVGPSSSFTTYQGVKE
jgi:hypothetical protein